MSQGLCTAAIGSSLAALAATVASAQTPALQLVDPKVLDVTLEIRVGAEDVAEAPIPPRVSTCFREIVIPGRPGRPATCRVDELTPRAFWMIDGRVELPVVPRGATHRIDLQSLRVEVKRGGVADPTAHQRGTLGELPLGMRVASVPLDNLFGGTGALPGATLEWAMHWRVEVHSTRFVNDAGFTEPDWPVAWPDELADALKPQPLIESDAPIFAQAVSHVAGDALRDVPVFYAAKDLIRHVMSQVQLSGDGNEYCEDRLKRYDADGALAAVQKRAGSVPDLVCACVAILRAAGIPARPVIGLTRDRRITAFHTWGELYVPEVGWVPFDVKVMRDRRSTLRNVREPWDGLGTIPGLNEYIPITYLFRLPGDSLDYPSPGIWAWEGVVRSPHLRQEIELHRKPAPPVVREH